MANGRDGYTATQYAEVAVKLLEAKHHVVAKQNMVALLGLHVVGSETSKAEALEAGERAFQRMLEFNALSSRPISDWAQDIPYEAFVDGDVVVTAPSAMDLFCMGRIKPQLEETLKEWKQKQKVGTWGMCGLVVVKWTPRHDFQLLA